MIAFAWHLLERGATPVELHPEGEHGKRHDVKATLEGLGFQHVSKHRTTKYEIPAFQALNKRLVVSWAASVLTYQFTTGSAVEVSRDRCSVGHISGHPISFLSGLLEGTKNSGAARNVRQNLEHGHIWDVPVSARGRKYLLITVSQRVSFSFSPASLGEGQRDVGRCFHS